MIVANINWTATSKTLGKLVLTLRKVEVIGGTWRLDRADFGLSPHKKNITTHFWLHKF